MPTIKAIVVDDVTVAPIIFLYRSFFHLFIKPYSYHFLALLGVAHLLHAENNPVTFNAGFFQEIQHV